MQRRNHCAGLRFSVSGWTCVHSCLLSLCGPGLQVRQRLTDFGTLLPDWQGADSRRLRSYINHQERVERVILKPRSRNHGSVQRPYQPIAKISRNCGSETTVPLPPNQARFPPLQDLEGLGFRIMSRSEATLRRPCWQRRGRISCHPTS